MLTRRNLLSALASASLWGLASRALRVEEGVELFDLTRISEMESAVVYGPHAQSETREESYRRINAEIDARLAQQTADAAEDLIWCENAWEPHPAGDRDPTRSYSTWDVTPPQPSPASSGDRAPRPPAGPGAWRRPQRGA